LEKRRVDQTSSYRDHTFLSIIYIVYFNLSIPSAIGHGAVFIEICLAPAFNRLHDHYYAAFDGPDINADGYLQRS